MSAHTAIAETDALIRELGEAVDPQTVRRRAATFLGWLLTDDAPLGLWQKMHFEMAIALLPTVWLQLCLTHLRIAQEPPSAEVLAEIAASRGAEYENVTRATLRERLRRVDL